MLKGPFNWAGVITKRVKIMLNVEVEIFIEFTEFYKSYKPKKQDEYKIYKIQIEIISQTLIILSQY